MAAAVLPAFAVAVAFLVLRRWLQGSSAEQAEARELRRRVAALRARLGMQRGDGFVFGCALAAAAAAAAAPKALPRNPSIRWTRVGLYPEDIMTCSKLGWV